MELIFYNRTRQTNERQRSQKGADEREGVKPEYESIFLSTRCIHTHKYKYINTYNVSIRPLVDQDTVQLTGEQINSN